MNLLAPVSTIMSTDLITVKPNDKLSLVQEIFQSNRIHHILVIDNQKLVGIISKSDFLFFQKGYKNKKVSRETQKLRLKVRKAKEIMTSKIAKMESHQKLDIALAIFKENLFHAIPVVEKGEVVGIITTYDFIKHLADDKEVVREYQLA